MCKFCAFSPTKTYRTAEILHISLSLEDPCFFSKEHHFPSQQKDIHFPSSLKIAMRTKLPSLWSSWLTVPSALDISIGLVGWIGLMDSSHNGPATKKSLSGLVKYHRCISWKDWGYSNGFPDWWRSNFIFIQINLAFCDQAVLKKPPYRLWQLILGIAVHWQMAKQIKLTKQPKIHESKLVAFLHSAMLR